MKMTVILKNEIFRYTSRPDTYFVFPLYKPKVDEYLNLLADFNELVDNYELALPCLSVQAVMDMYLVSTEELLEHGPEVVTEMIKCGRSECLYMDELNTFLLTKIPINNLCCVYSVGGIYYEGSAKVKMGIDKVRSSKLARSTLTSLKFALMYEGEKE